MPDRNAIPRTAEPDAEPGWKLRLEERLGLLDPIIVLVFRSFGTPDALHLRGRVLERKGTEGSTEESSTWRTLLDNLHRLESNEIPGARLRAHFQGKQWETTTDQEGFFVVDIEPVEPLPPGWHEVELELVESIGEPERRRFRGEVLVPSPDSEFAVVSDLDDTVIETHSTELFEQLAIVFGHSARGRVVFPGIPAFYRALSRGPDDQGGNPIFYVSRSSWNLNDLFEEFMDVNDIPKGPLFLRDFRITEDRSAVLGRDDSKFASIDLLMRTYPELPFVLIGDSGMHDPELYGEIARKHPGRVRAVYIHDVSPPERDREVREIAEALGPQGVPLVASESALRAAEHACEEGLISPQSLDEIRREVERQQSGKKSQSQ